MGARSGGPPLLAPRLLRAPAGSRPSYARSAGNPGTLAAVLSAASTDAKGAVRQSSAAASGWDFAPAREQHRPPPLALCSFVAAWAAGTGSAALGLGRPEAGAGSDENWTAETAE